MTPRRIRAMSCLLCDLKSQNYKGVNADCRLVPHALCISRIVEVKDSRLWFETHLRCLREKLAWG